MIKILPIQVWFEKVGSTVYSKADVVEKVFLKIKSRPMEKKSLKKTFCPLKEFSTSKDM